MYFRIILFLLLTGCTFDTSAQTFNPDSCGLNTEPVLNEHEILFAETYLFKPIVTKKASTVDPKDGFDFRNKKMAFFSCSLNSSTGNGFMTKPKFFESVKPDARGHAGKGLIQLTEAERESTGFDGIIVIDCPYPRVTRKQMITKLKEVTY